MRKTRFSLLIALALLCALLFSLRQANVGLAGSNPQQPRAGTIIGMVQQTKQVAPAADASIRADQPSTKLGKENTLRIANGNNVPGNALIYFQVEDGVVPYQSIVNSAVLKLTLTGGTQVPTAISVRTVITNWNGLEDTSLWEDNVTWSTKPPVSASIVTEVPITPGNDLSIDITDLYAGWLNDPGNFLNFGIELRGKNEASAYEYFFGSRESANGPVIEVDYTPQPTNIVIPKITGTVTIDNKCSEYPNNGYKFVDSGQHYSSVYVAHDDQYLYFCAENVVSNFSDRFYALYIDTDNGKEANAEQDDLAFYTNPITKKADNRWGNGGDKYDPIPCLIAPPPESCDGSTAVKLQNWEALSGVVTTPQAMEVAEYKIKLDLISVNCQERKIGMSFYHHWVNDIADDYGWPTDRWFSEPRTWIEASFDQLPTSLPATCGPVQPIPTVTPSLYLPVVNR